jgi:hypothetical protein
MGQVALRTAIGSHRFMDYPTLIFLDQFSMAVYAILAFRPLPLLRFLGGGDASAYEQGKAKNHQYTQKHYIPFFHSNLIKCMLIIKTLSYA